MVGAVPLATMALGLGTLGSVPVCGGCIGSLGMWGLSMFFSFWLGLVASIVADWGAVEYDAGLRTGALLGMRAPLVATLIAGTVFTCAAALGRIGILSVGESHHGSGGDDGFAAAVLIVWDGAQNLVGPSIAGALTGGLPGLIVGAIRRRPDATPDRIASPVRVTLLTGVAVGSAALVALAAIGSWIAMGAMGSRSTARARPTAAAERTPDDDLQAWADDGINPCLGAEDPDCQGGSAPAPRPGGGARAVPQPPSIEVFPATMRASRELMTEGRYPAIQAFDGRMETAWAVRDAVAGDYLEACFDGAIPVGRVWLTTGYDHTSRRGTNLFTANARLRDFAIELRDGGRAVETRVLFARSDQRAREVDFLGARGDCVRFVVHTVWPGTRWQDLSISEVRIHRRGPDDREERFGACDTSADGYVDSDEAAAPGCGEFEDTGIE